MVSFVSLFQLLGVLFIALVPLVLLMKRPARGGGPVAAQDVVAGVAAVVTELHVDVVTPGLAEPGAIEVLEAIPPLDGQRLELPPDRVVGRVGGELLRGGFPASDVADVEPPDTGGDHDDDQQRQRVRPPAAPGGNDTRHIAVLALETVEC